VAIPCEEHRERIMFSAPLWRLLPAVFAQSCKGCTCQNLQLSSRNATPRSGGDDPCPIHVDPHAKKKRRFRVFFFQGLVSWMQVSITHNLIGFGRWVRENNL
jgi:hypothetical protein